MLDSRIYGEARHNAAIPLSPRAGRAYVRAIEATRQARGNLSGLAQLGASDDWSFGAALWEFLHPGRVQEEEILIRGEGYEPRSYVEIWSDAAGAMWSDVEEETANIAETAEKVITSGATIGRWVLIGGAIYLAIQGAALLKKGKP